MNRANFFVVLASTALLAGCATEWDRSYARWSRYVAEPGPYRDWTHCVRERSFRHIGPQASPSRSPQGAVARNLGQLFTYVLADCRELMSGPGWEFLSEGEVAQLVADAYREFHRVYVSIEAHNFLGIISESQN